MSFNKRLLTVEDYNSIVEHFGKAVTDYYLLDTRILSSEYWFAYDFIEIYRSEDKIVFNIKNSLWTGGYYIKECNISNYTSSADSNTIIISGNGLEYVVLVLELSSTYIWNHYTELSFNPYYVPFIKPFYDELKLDIGFVNKTDEPVVNLPVWDNENREFIYTNNDGEISIISHLKKPDLFYRNIIVHENAQVNYYFPFIVLKADLPVIITSENIFKDKKNIVSFRFLFDNKYDITDEILFSNNNISLIVNGKSYSVNDYNDGNFNFIVDLTDYFGDNVNMKLVIGGNDYLNSNTLNFIEEVTYFTTDDENVLKEEIEDGDGADTIFFNGNSLSVPINVYRDVSIEFYNPIFNGENNVTPFIVDQGAVLSLINLNFIANNGSNVVLVHDGKLVCSNSNFEFCTGTAIISKKGDVTIENCVFNNNYSCIDVSDNLSIYNSTFNLDDEEFIDKGSVAFINVLNSLTIDYCKFNIDLSGLSSLGLTYVFFKLGKSCTVNNIKSSNLLVNQTFPVKYNTSNVNVESSRFIIHNITNKCVIWTVEDTNTVYYNDVVVEYV